MKKLLIILLLFTVLVPALATTCPEKYKRHDWPHWSRFYYKLIKDPLVKMKFTPCRGYKVYTRDAVLILRSTETVKVELNHRYKKCRVVSGRWRSFMTGEEILESKLIDIDHHIPLGFAHGHGGACWSRHKKKLYANFTEYNDKNVDYHLTITEFSLNREKGKKGPTQWIPDKYECSVKKERVNGRMTKVKYDCKYISAVYQCRYIQKFDNIMQTWGLLFADENEVSYYSEMFERICNKANDERKKSVFSFFQSILDLF